MTDIRITRQELIEQLEVKRAEAAALDGQRRAAHEAEERAWLKQAQAVCREAAKIKDPKQMADIISWRGSLSARCGRPPACPVSLEARYATAIASLRLSNQKTYTISQSGKFKDVWRMLIDPVVKTATDGTVCG